MRQPTGRRCELLDGDDHVGGHPGAGGRLPDRLGARRLVQAVRLLAVGGEERVDPPDADLVVDELDPFVVEQLGVELLGEVPFDDVEAHGFPS